MFLAPETCSIHVTRNRRLLSMPRHRFIQSVFLSFGCPPSSRLLPPAFRHFGYENIEAGGKEGPRCRTKNAWWDMIFKPLSSPPLRLDTPSYSSCNGLAPLLAPLAACVAQIISSLSSYTAGTRFQPVGSSQSSRVTPSSYRIYMTIFNSCRPFFGLLRELARLVCGCFRWLPHGLFHVVHG